MGGGIDAALARFQQRYPRAINKTAVEAAAAAWPGLSVARDQSIADGWKWINKAAVAPGDTITPSWAGTLAQPSIFDGLLAAIRAESIFGVLPVSRVPFNTKIPKLTTGAGFGWVGQGLPKKAAKMILSSAMLGPTKAAAVVAFTRELLTLMPPGAERMINDALTSNCVAFTDREFLSSAAPVAGVSPGGALNGIVAITPGATPDDSLSKLLAAFYTALPTASKPRLIMSPASASAFSALRTTPGPGIPEVVVTPHAGAHVIALDASMIALADGGVILDVSTEADYQADDAPTSPITAAVLYTSLWQNNLTGIKTERVINWDASGAGVQYFDLVAGA
jgi:HK97 family phage major capsid protein